MEGSREMGEEGVATLEKGEDHGFDQGEVTWDQKLDIIRGSICQDLLWMEDPSLWLPPF